MPDHHIRGARTHNLQNIDLALPRDRLIVITGLSGSGKSSLAFDTIYAEGQRRYVESLSAYARQFLSMMEKPDVDHIEGLSPAIAIEQKSTSHNPRSTVGTVTEIYDYLRLLFARAGMPRCPDHGARPRGADREPDGRPGAGAARGHARSLLLAPVIAERKGEHPQAARGAARHRASFARASTARSSSSTTRRGSIRSASTRSRWSSTASGCAPTLQQRLAESFETALRARRRRRRASRLLDEPEREELIFSDRFACSVCGYSLSELEPRLFSFNNPVGACPACDGLGVKQFFDPERVVATRTCRSPAARCAAGTGATPTTSSSIQALADHYDFDVEAPWLELPQKRVSDVAPVRQRRRADRVPLPRRARRHDASGRHRFEGIIPNLERRYRETESRAVREELAQLPEHAACPECEGTRLNRGRAPRVRRRAALPDVTAPVGRATRCAFFARSTLEGWRGEDRRARS